MSRFIDKMIENDIDTANDHLPLRKVSLASALLEQKPSYITRSGEHSGFIVEELLRIADEIPAEYHSTFMLPIVILRRMDLGHGIYTIAGSKTELFFIHRAIANSEVRWDSLRSWHPVEKLARPQVQVIRRKMPSTTCLGFTTSINTNDDSQ